jgi:hypothetical protein
VRLARKLINMQSEPRHQCLIYDGPPSEKLSLLAAIVMRRLNEGYRCLYLNSAPMVAGMRSTLASMNLDVADEVAKGRLVMSFEPVSPRGDFNALDQAVNEGFKGLWASGDITWEFGPQQDFSKLLEYEFKLEEVFSRRKELCGVCQYHNGSLPKDVMRKSLLTHPGVVISETLTQINPHYLSSSWPPDQTISLELDKTITGFCTCPKLDDLDIGNEDPLGNS